MIPKIATEENVSSIDELIDFLKKNNHPIAENIGVEVEVEDTAESPVEEEAEYAGYADSGEEATISVPTMTMPAGFGGLPKGIKIVLKNAVIKAEQIIITRESDKK